MRGPAVRPPLRRLPACGSCPHECPPFNSSFFFYRFSISSNTPQSRRGSDGNSPSAGSDYGAALDCAAAQTPICLAGLIESKELSVGAQRARFRQRDHLRQFVLGSVICGRNRTLKWNAHKVEGQSAAADTDNSGLVLASQSHSFAPMFAAYLALGVAEVGGMFLPAAYVVTNQFTERRGRGLWAPGSRAAGPAARRRLGLTHCQLDRGRWVSPPCSSGSGLCRT